MGCRYIRPHGHNGILGHRELHDLMLEREALLEEESRFRQRDSLLLPVPCPNLERPVAMELRMPNANNLRPGARSGTFSCVTKYIVTKEGLKKSHVA